MPAICWGEETEGGGVQRKAPGIGGQDWGNRVPSIHPESSVKTVDRGTRTFPQPLYQLGSLTNLGVTPAQLRDPVSPPTTSSLPSPPAETILNAQRCVFRAQEPQGAFISGDVGKQARGSGCRYRSVHTNNDTLIRRRHTCSKQPPSSRLDCAVPRAHMKPTSAENTKTVHVGDAPLPDGRVRPIHVHATGQDQCL